MFPQRQTKSNGAFEKSREVYVFIELVWVAILSWKELMYQPGAISGMPKGTWWLPARLIVFLEFIVYWYTWKDSLDSRLSFGSKSMMRGSYLNVYAVMETDSVHHRCTIRSWVYNWERLLGCPNTYETDEYCRHTIYSIATGPGEQPDPNHLPTCLLLFPGTTIL